MNIENLNWDKFQAGLEKIVDALVREAFTSTMDNAIHKAFHSEPNNTEADRIKHNYIMGLEKQHSLMSLAEFRAQQ